MIGETAPIDYYLDRHAKGDPEYAVRIDLPPNHSGHRYTEFRSRDGALTVRVATWLLED